MPSLSRSENVCGGCRSRKKKCDGLRPQCSPCRRRGRHCLYHVTMSAVSWGLLAENTETRMDPATALDPTVASFGDVVDMQHASTLLWPMTFPELEGPPTFDTSLPDSEDASPSLPSWGVLMELVDNFFRKHYAHLPIIHRERFTSELHRRGIQGSSQALLYAMCAVAAKTHPDPSVRERQRQWFGMAKSRVAESMSSKSMVLATLQAAALVVHRSIEMMDFCTPWQLLGNAWRKAVLTGCAHIDGKARAVPWDVGVVETGCWIQREECRRAIWALFVFDRCLCTTDLPRAIDNRHVLINLPMAEDEFQGDSEPANAAPVRFAASFDDLCARVQRQTLQRRRTVFQYLVMAHHLLGCAGEELSQPEFDYGRDRATVESLTSKLVRLRLAIPRHAIDLSAADPSDFALVVWLNAVMASIAFLLHFQPLTRGEGDQGPDGHCENWPHCLAAARSLVTCLRDMCRTSIDFASNTFLLSSVFVCARILLIERCTSAGLDRTRDGQDKNDPGVEDDLEILAFVLRHFRESLGDLGRKFYNGFIYFSRAGEEQCRTAKAGTLLDLLRPNDEWPNYSDDEAVYVS